MNLKISAALTLLLCTFGLISAGKLQTRYLPPNFGPTSQQTATRRIQQPAAAVSAPRTYNAGQRLGNNFRAHSNTHSHRQSNNNNNNNNIPILRNDFFDDGKGNYNFAFDTGNGIHRDEAGEFRGGWPHGSLDVKGSYSYTGDDGKVYTVNYTADKNGFHPIGNHLPQSPALPKTSKKYTGKTQHQRFQGSGYLYGGKSFY